MLSSISWVERLVALWMSILIEMHDEVSWILNLDTLLYPASTSHYLFLFPETPKALPCSLCPFSPLFPLLRWKHQGQASSCPEISALPQTPRWPSTLTSTARIPWIRKPEMFPWLLRLILARQQGEGNEEPSSEFLLDPRLLLRAMPWEGDLPTGLEAVPKG